MNEFISAPILSCINITDFCNISCQYCYTHNHNRNFMSADKVAEIVLDLSRQGVWQIVLGGGEPFAHPDILDILHRIVSEDVDIGVITNGTILTENHIAGLQRLSSQYPGLLNLQVSLDSIRPSINDVLRQRGQRVLSTIETMIAAALPMSTGTVIHRHNAAYAHEVIEFYYPRIKKFHFMQLMPSYSVQKLDHDCAPEPTDLERLLGRLRNAQSALKDAIITFPDLSRVVTDKNLPSLKCAGCTAAVTRMDINANGDVLACNIADRSVIGNVYDQPLSEIWRSAAADGYRNDTLPICMKDFLLKQPGGFWTSPAAS